MHGERGARGGVHEIGEMQKVRVIREIGEIRENTGRAMNCATTHCPMLPLVYPKSDKPHDEADRQINLYHRKYRQTRIMEHENPRPNPDRAYDAGNRRVFDV